MLASESVDGILCLNVNAADRALENADLCAVAAGLDHAGLFLDADDLTDDTANGCDLVANLKIVSHCRDLLFLLLLRTDPEEIEGYENDSQHNEGNPHGATARGILGEHKSCVKHGY